MQSGLVNMILMSPAVGVDSEWGGRKLSKKTLRPIVLEILELNVFFSHSNKIKAKF